MTFRTCSLSLAGVALLAVSSTVALAHEQHQLSFRNDVGHIIVCGLRRAGSSAVDSFTLRAGQSWSKTYSGPKTRLVLCEGTFSQWQPLDPDRTYRLVKAAAERIVAESDSGR